jgi:fermentation-respiration switch protein FrsA (DUF1100 family)
MRAFATWLGRGLGAVTTVALAAVIVLGLFGLGFSSGIGDNYVDLQSLDGPRTFGYVITGFVNDAVTLEGGDGGELTRDGVWGLAYPGGYGRIGEVISNSGVSVTREFVTAEGEDPVPGSVARLDPATWSGGPEAAGLAYEDVTFTTELGAYPSWLIGAPADTWLIVVHHKGVSRDEGLRMASIAADAGLATLIVSYRNDRDAPPGPEQEYTWGVTEWRDLEGAVRYAGANGASRVIAAGYGMGGSIVMAFLEQSELANEVSAVILDSPVIDLSATVAHDLSQDTLGEVFDLPTAFNASARLIGGWRFGLDWNALDYGDAPPTIPMLIFHGDADQVTPLAESQGFAAASSRVELVVTEGAGFTESWNVDPDAYRTTVLSFIGGL